MYNFEIGGMGFNPIRSLVIAVLIVVLSGFIGVIDKYRKRHQLNSWWKALFQFIGECIERSEPLKMGRTMIDFDKFVEPFSFLYSPIVTSTVLCEGYLKIVIEHAGLRAGVSHNMHSIIRRVILIVKRYYQSIGIEISSDDIYVVYTENYVVILVALNTYGAKQIKKLKDEQARTLAK